MEHGYKDIVEIDYLYDQSTEKYQATVKYLKTNAEIVDIFSWNGNRDIQWLDSSFEIGEAEIAQLTDDEIRQRIDNEIARREQEIQQSVQSYFESLENQSPGESLANGAMNVTVDDKNVMIASNENQVLYFINYARMYLNCEDDDNYMAMAFGYLFIYIALIVFTAMFAIRYVKRVIYLAFLTLMAPMVALTYPLDKIKDRKSPSI